MNTKLTVKLLQRLQSFLQRGMYGAIYRLEYGDDSFQLFNMLFFVGWARLSLYCRFLLLAMDYTVWSMNIECFLGFLFLSIGMWQITRFDIALREWFFLRLRVSLFFFQDLLTSVYSLRDLLYMGATQKVNRKCWESMGQWQDLQSIISDSESLSVKDCWNAPSVVNAGCACLYEWWT